MGDLQERLSRYRKYISKYYVSIQSGMDFSFMRYKNGMPEI
jgi:hypothetical protein